VNLIKSDKYSETIFQSNTNTETKQINIYNVQYAQNQYYQSLSIANDPIDHILSIVSIPLLTPKL